MREKSLRVHVKHIYLHTASGVSDVHDGTDGLELSLDMWNGQGLNDHDDQYHGQDAGYTTTAEHDKVRFQKTNIVYSVIT